ncbi:putative DNA methylase [Klebsiella phage vB_KpnS_Call]|uniref:Putative DNA methylase n=1 Tax=Klebsiella phage vB_KpnS_Call TaxID=2591371 RepID=A0A5B9NE35_9CAUD|nr:putative DNA methylase [Klebsiella phage vB_KpnS_Call]QEG12497.1 putative DNA methylase [Klebsiella phage vB_KpnS_Call]
MTSTIPQTYKIMIEKIRAPGPCIENSAVITAIVNFILVFSVAFRWNNYTRN